MCLFDYPKLSLLKMNTFFLWFIVEHFLYIKCPKGCGPQKKTPMRSLKNKMFVYQMFNLLQGEKKQNKSVIVSQ